MATGLAVWWIRISYSSVLVFMCDHMSLVVMMVVVAMVDFGCELRLGFWVEIRLWVVFDLNVGLVLAMFDRIEF